MKGTATNTPNFKGGWMLANQIDLQLKVLAKTDQSVSRSNEKLKFETSALVTLYGDQFKLSTQFIKQN